MAFDYAEYYKKNRERILQKRRQKYALDPEYRKKVKKRNAEYHRRTSKPKKPIESYQMVKVEDKTYFTIGIFAKAIGRKTITVREYHRRGLLPPPIFVNSRGWRLYSQKQTIFAKKCFKKFDNHEITQEELIKQLKEGWDA